MIKSSFNQWTVGAVYHSTIIRAETLGTTNTSRTIDLNANTGNVYTPAYAIYENGAISRVALFNYVNDPSGNSDLQVTLNIPTGNPPSVTVKYLVGPSVSSKCNIAWAGQVCLQSPCDLFFCRKYLSLLWFVDNGKHVSSRWLL